MAKPAFWKTLGRDQRVEVDMGPPPMTRTELCDRCAAARVVAEMHGLRWARVVHSPRLVFVFWYPTEEEIRREKRHRQALERQVSDHIRWVTSH